MWAKGVRSSVCVDYMYYVNIVYTNLRARLSAYLRRRRHTPVYLRPGEVRRIAGWCLCLALLASDLAAYFTPPHPHLTSLQCPSETRRTAPKEKPHNVTWRMRNVRPWTDKRENSIINLWKCGHVSVLFACVTVVRSEFENLPRSEIRHRAKETDRLTGWDASSSWAYEGDGKGGRMKNHEKPDVWHSNSMMTTMIMMLSRFIFFSVHYSIKPRRIFTKQVATYFHRIRLRAITPLLATKIKLQITRISVALRADVFRLLCDVNVEKWCRASYCKQKYLYLVSLHFKHSVMQ